MTQKTRDTGTSTDLTAGATGHVKDTVGDIAVEVKETASDVADKARRQVGQKVESQKDRAAGGLGEMASVLRRTSSEMREQQDSAVPEYIDKAAEQVERISGYLRNASVGDMIGGVERFARREPILFLGGAFALGLLGARFLKASSPERGGYRGERREVGRGDVGSYGYGYAGGGYGAPGGEYGATRGGYGGTDRYRAPRGYGDPNTSHPGSADDEFDARVTARNWPPAQTSSSGVGKSEIGGSTMSAAGISTTGAAGAKTSTGSGSSTTQRKTSGKGSV